MAPSRGRVRYRLVRDGSPEVAVSDRPLRLGYGKDCELSLEGSEGPPVLFEVHPSDGPLQIATRLPPEELSSYVDLAVDGAPLDAPVRGLRPGSRIELLDKGSGRRYELVLEPPSPWSVRLRFLAIAVLFLTVLGGIYAAYVFTQLEHTRGTLDTTRSRLERTERSVRETLDWMASAEVRVREALAALAAERSAADDALRADLERRMDVLGADARDTLDRLSERDVEARRALRADVEEQVEALRSEFAGRLVESFQRFKTLERELLDALAVRTQAVEPSSERFKRVLDAARQATLFIHTRYEVEFPDQPQGERIFVDAYGTGFVVAPDGTAITAQHVLFPWRYERDLVLLQSIGRARIVEAGTHWAAWATDRRVIEPGGSLNDPIVANAFVSTGPAPTLRFLYAPEPATDEHTVQTAFGPVRIRIPRPGPTDVAVIRLEGHGGGLAHLPVASADPVEPLDELLAIGYPLSRLVEGIAHPQAVRGVVRRVGNEALEIDVPLHPGISGAPLLDADGAVVGMASAAHASAVYGLAAPVESLRAALEAALGAGRGEAPGPGAVGAPVVE